MVAAAGLEPATYSYSNQRSAFSNQPNLIHRKRPFRGLKPSRTVRARQRSRALTPSDGLQDIAVFGLVAAAGLEPATYGLSATSQILVNQRLFTPFDGQKSADLGTVVTSVVTKIDSKLRGTSGSPLACLPPKLSR